MGEQMQISRRQFLKLSLTASGALLVGVPLPSWAAQTSLEDDAGDSYMHTAWIKISPNDQITLIIDKSEMGQGVVTALSMLLAEELEVDLSKIRTEFAPIGKVYNNPAMRSQVTGGSTSISTSWMRLRQAGAATRELFIQAAATKWNVAASECFAKEGRVSHSKSRQQISYGQLSAIVTTLTAPDLDDVVLKSPADFKLIGQPVKRLDAATKIDGSAVYGIDVKIQDMLIATIVQAPVFGSTVKSIDDAAAKEQRGVKYVVNLESSVAVVADNWWRAQQGAEKLNIDWTPHPNDSLNDEKIFTRWQQLEKEEDGKEARHEGDVEDAFKSAETTIESVYRLPYQAHATMEPMNCVAHVQEKRCDIWAPTQSPSGCLETAANITRIDHDNIFIHTTYLGGGFGRRANTDFVEQAVKISQAVKAPIKLVWTREEDIQHDFYRPANYNVMRAALDKNGKPTAWQHRIVGPSILENLLPTFVPMVLPQWLGHGMKKFFANVTGSLMGMTYDRTSTEGAENVPYAIPNIKVEYVKDDPGIPVGFWRSVGNSQNAFMVESFIDELAHAAQQDAYRFRRDLLKDKPRHLAVLDLVATKAGWKMPLPAGRFRGLAIHEAFGSVIAEVAEISIDAQRQVHVHRVVCAVDCGIVINPNIIAQQMESSVVFALTATLKSQVKIEQGKVQQSNFHDFTLLRNGETPEVETHIVASAEPPSGIGEPGVPPLAPAVANAVFSATGVRIKTLPIRPDDLLQKA